MFTNIGSKIKTWAQIACWLGIVISIVCGISLMSTGSSTITYNGYRYQTGSSNILPGFLFMVLGALFSWISSFFLYGFGELIEKTNKNNDLLALIAENTSRSTCVSNVPLPSAPKETAAPKAPQAPGGDWTCKHCQSVNSSMSYFCKDCGKCK